MNRIFSRYTSWHSFKRLEMRRVFDHYQQGNISRNQFERYLLQRDHKLWAEMETSGVANNYVDILLNLFPGAKYILMLRDCYSWCDSHINQEINYPQTSHYPLDVNSLSEEKNMEFVLDRALIQWKNCAERVISRCPTNKLLILQTRHLSYRMDDISRFVGVPKDTLIPELAHSNQTHRKHYMLLRVPQRLLKEKFEQYCAPIMERYFPDITLDSFLDQSEQERKNSCKDSPRDSRYHFFPWLQKAEQFLAVGDKVKAGKCLDAALLMRPDNGALRRIHALKKMVDISEIRRGGMEGVLDLTEDLDNPGLWLRRTERFIFKGDYLAARNCLVQFENVVSSPDRKSLRHFAALYLRLRELLISKNVMLNGLDA